MVSAGRDSKGERDHQYGDRGGYGVSRTEPNPDDYLQQNYLLKVQSKFDGGHTLGLSGSYFDRQDKSIDMAAAIETYAPGQSRLTDTSRRESVALDYGWVAPNGNALVDLVDAQIYWQRVNLSSNLAAMRIAARLAATMRAITVCRSPRTASTPLRLRRSAAVSRSSGSWALNGMAIQRSSGQRGGYLSGPIQPLFAVQFPAYQSGRYA